MRVAGDVLDRARTVAGSVVDPELPMLTLEDLGVVRDVALEDGRVVVTLTPTYTGCPALATMKADVRVALAAAGFGEVDVRVTLTPAWSTDWITDRGRNRLREHGIAPPGPAPVFTGPVPVRLLPGPPSAECPRCGSAETRELAGFGSSSCTALHQCRTCGEPFEGIKPL